MIFGPLIHYVSQMFVSHRRRQVRHVILTCDVHAMLMCDVIREYKDMCAHIKKVHVTDNI